MVALTDNAGTAVDTLTYAPNRVTASSTGTVYESWQFQGQYADNSQGRRYQVGAFQYHNGARYHEVGQMNGQCTQMDPISNPFETHCWNGDNYAGGDTANLTDPDGSWFSGLSLSWVCEVWW